MTLVFALLVATLFASLLAVESSAQGGESAIRPHSLLRWLTTDNWPAKVGALLILIGVGALLRYAMLHFNAPDHVKLGGGMLLTVLTGLAAHACRTDSKRRALHFALGGTAFGIAYLCAYASFGIFGYVEELVGITLLLTVAITAAVYAASARALSIAVLSMIGAYLAPAFAVTPQPPLVVLGYYALVSLLAFALVMVRAWRPLIHLSFLFTLAGGLFFGWTQDFYRPEHFGVMQPMLLLLVAIHVAMPLAEQQAVRAPWLIRLDAVYQTCLPLAAAVLMWRIAPTADPDTAIGFAFLGSLWLASASYTWFARVPREIPLAPAAIGLLFLFAGLLIHFHDLSWPLIGLCAFSLTVVLAARFERSGALQLLAAILALLSHVLFVIDGRRFVPGSLPFIHSGMIENVVAAAALLIAGASYQPRRSLPGFALLLAGGLWASVVVMTELLRIDLPHLPQFAHGVLIVATASLAFAPLAAPRRELLLRVVVALLVATSLWAATGGDPPLTLTLGAITLGALLLVFYRRVAASDETSQKVPIEAFALPFVALIWGAASYEALAAPPVHLSLGLVAAIMLATLLIARRHHWRQAEFNGFLLPALFVVGIALLGYAHTLHIARGAWPVACELLGLAFLIAVTAGIPDRQEARLPTVAMAVVVALMLQAQVLRIFGPAGVLSFADITRIGWPTVISLLWALMGATLAWVSQRLASRSVWSIGAGLMAVAAVKLVVFDFGSLGELQNILALIAAGLVFLAVAWLVPLPPKAALQETRTDVPKVSPTPRAVDNSATAPREIHAAASLPPALPTMAMPQRTPTATTPAAPDDTRSTMPKAPIRPAVPKRTENESNWRTMGTVAILCIAAGLTFLYVVLHKRPVHRTPAASVAPVKPPASARPAQPAKPSPQFPEQERPAPVASPPEIEREPALAEAPAPKILTTCEQFLRKLPDDYRIFAGGAYAGAPTGQSIDDSGHLATRFLVLVDEPSVPVVLALGAYEPSVWQIRAAPGTTIAGIVLTGYHRQAIKSGADHVPVLVSTYDNRSTCGYFTTDPHGFVGRFFDRPATGYFAANSGILRIGSNARFDADDDRELGGPITPKLAGAQGIDQLLREGKLRRANQADLAAFPGLTDRSNSGSISAYYLLSTYVALRHFEIPAGLTGAHSVTFLVPYGVPTPTGNPGHSRIIEMPPRP